MTIYKAPNFTPFNIRQKGDLVFLAGSIEMGKAENWQEVAGELISNAGYVVLNPRRDDWDSTWEQTIENEQFNQQVTWELKGLEDAKAVLVHFDPDTKSPITLLEVGLLAILKPKRTFISCPPGYWRRGNVEIVSERYEMPMFDSLEEATGALIQKLWEMEAKREDGGGPTMAAF